MPSPIEVVVERTEIAAELSALAQMWKLSLSLRMASESPLSREIDGIVWIQAPRLHDLCGWVLGDESPSKPRLACILSAGEKGFASAELDWLRDCGVAIAGDLTTFLLLIRLRELLFVGPVDSERGRVSVRGLDAFDRSRLGEILHHDSGPRLVRVDSMSLAIECAPTAEEHVEPIVLGSPETVGRALRILQQAIPLPRNRDRNLVQCDPARIEAVLFGPPRSLSDPSSKTVLSYFGIPMPIETLCTSTSRAASEAANLGYPVRLTLASPDLRIWDHPDLSVDGVSSATGVRDLFRQLLQLAQERDSEARLLGVHVTATVLSDAWLQLVLKPVGSGRVLCEIGFADLHGLASSDRTSMLLPSDTARLDRALSRLSGRSMILHGNASQRRRALETIDDVLHRLHSFFIAHGAGVRSVIIRPLALLVGGGIEVREASIEVGDYFEKRLPSGG